MSNTSKEKKKATILQSLCYVNDEVFVLATKAGLFRYDHNKWHSIPLPEL